MKLIDLKSIDLTEMAPFVHGGTYDPKETLTKISDGALSRDYISLGSIDVEDLKINLFMLDNYKSVLGVIPSDEKVVNRTNRNFIIFSLRFKKELTLKKVPSQIKYKKVLQVNSVYTAAEYKGFGIASSVYKLLLKLNFAVVSDDTQFEDGKELWKKIAAESSTKYKVYVLDKDYGIITKDGKPVKYDTTNLDDGEIWSSGEDYHGFDKVLILN